MHRWAAPAWATLLALAVLGPALRPGFILSYDMVFVPDPAFSWSQLGLGAELPRAVPLDAVTTAVSVLLPTSLLQKTLLLTSLLAAGLGAAALVPALPVLARLVAVTVAIWNPFVAERLVLGHWGLLLAYAALPWLIVVVGRQREGSGGRAVVLALLAVCALTPSGGVLSLAVLTVTGWSRDRRARHRLGTLVAGWVLLNATWWLPGLLHASSTEADPTGVAVFAARAELWGGVLPTVLGLGGIWNADVVPHSRSTALGVASLLLVATLAVSGVRPLVRADRHLAGALAVLALLGLTLALLGATPGVSAALEWAVRNVPGAGLLRDGQKFVALMVPLVATLAACGAARLARLAPDDAGGAVLVAASLLQVALLPDLAWGAGGRLEAVSYPSAWSSVRDQMARERADGDLLLLPWSAFRVYAWNEDRTVLDPARRFFPRQTLADDRLAVGRRVLGPEDPRAAAVGAAITDGRLDADFLRGQGVRLVLVQTDQPAVARPVPGTVEVVHPPGLRLLRVPGPVMAGDAVPGGTAGKVAVVLGDLVALALVVGAVAACLRRRAGLPRRSGPTRRARC